MRGERASLGDSALRHHLPSHHPQISAAQQAMSAGVHSPHHPPSRKPRDARALLGPMGPRGWLRFALGVAVGGRHASALAVSSWVEMTLWLVLWGRLRLGCRRVCRVAPTSPLPLLAHGAVGTEELS